MTGSADPAARIGAFDGMRGIAYIMIILAHGWTLFPFEGIRSTPLIAWLFVNGGYAVSVFLIFGGYFAARSLLPQIQRITPQLTLAWLGRRVIRVSIALYVLLAALLILDYFEKPAPYSSKQTSNSVFAIATHTWNWFLMSNPLAARPDLGHLWYVSVYIQVIIVFAAAFYLLRRHLTVLAWVLTVSIIGVTVWRAYAIATGTIENALLMTSTRCDGLLWGALLALLMPRLDALRPHAHAIASFATVAVVALWITGTPVNYFQLPGAAFNLAIVMLMIGITHSRADFRLARFLRWQPFRAIGRRSLSIYVWHYTLFWTITRHTGHWHWLERTAFAYLLLFLIVECVHRKIDEPLRLWLEDRLRSRPPAEPVQT